MSNGGPQLDPFLFDSNLLPSSTLTPRVSGRNRQRGRAGVWERVIHNICNEVYFWRPITHFHIILIRIAHTNKQKLKRIDEKKLNSDNLISSRNKPLERESFKVIVKDFSLSYISESQALANAY